MATSAPPIDSTVTALPTPQEVGAWYDNADSLCQLMSGDSFHFGMWLKDDGTPATRSRDLMTQAQDRMTDFFIDLLRPQPGQSMLDVGCGHGTPAIRAAQRTRTTVTGCSISRAQVQEATRRAAIAGINDSARFEHADAMNLPYESSTFDAAWSLDAFPHLSDPVRALRELRRVVRPGAPVLVTFYTQRVAATAAELAMFRSFAFCPLPTVSQVIDQIHQAGLELEQYRDLTPHITLSSDFFSHISQENRQAIAAELGPDLAEEMGTALPQLLDFFKNRTGYVACLLRNPEA
ncbi:SAM-dependent methyltransferase [Streptomyces sp. NBC_01546]|uniref:SAM-dependent methyltransferase n=1 Tax=Streptomyces sp. NBC_01546 TaxID=2975872 RepID=UPI0038634B35